MPEQVSEQGDVRWTTFILHYQINRETQEKECSTYILLTELRAAFDSADMQVMIDMLKKRKMKDQVRRKNAYI